MKQSILGSDMRLFTKKLNGEKSICIATLCVTVVLNVLLTFLRNDQNHSLMLWLNIVLDVAAGWFLIFYISCLIAPKQRLLRLFNGKRSAFEGTVTAISAETQRVRNVDCFTVTLTAGETERQFFLPANTALSLKEKEYVQISAVSNIIVQILL